MQYFPEIFRHWHSTSSIINISRVVNDAEKSVGVSRREAEATTLNIRTGNNEKNEISAVLHKELRYIPVSVSNETNNCLHTWYLGHS